MRRRAAPAIGCRGLCSCSASLRAGVILQAPASYRRPGGMFSRSLPGANRPVWIIRNNDLIEQKPDKLSIAGYTEYDQQYTNRTIQLEKGDSVYVFTDGIVDQFGGPDGKKFMSKRLKELLIEINTKPMSEQELVLKGAIENWQGKLEQIDDILVLGMKI